MTYTPTSWQDSPSTSTPITAANLNHIENGLVALDTGKAPLQAPWTATTFYKQGQLVTNGGQLWQANADHTSGSSFSSANWTAIGGGGGGGSTVLTDKGAWTTGTAYSVDDVVTNAGVRYVCTSAHTASASFSTDLPTKWTQTGADSSSIAPLAQSGQTPSQAPVAATSGGAVGTQAFAARADHSHPSAGSRAMFADGSSGAITLDGTVTFASNFITKSGSVYTTQRSLYLTNLTVNSGITLIVSPGTILFVNGTLTNNGNINSDGLSASGSTSGGAAALAGTAYFGYGLTTSGNGSTGAGAGTNGYGSVSLWLVGMGGVGGAGSGGAGGPATSGQVWSNSSGGLQQRTVIRAVYGSQHSVVQDRPMGGGVAGGCGGGDGTNSGGGGGAGANSMIINAFALVNNGTISCNGGNGGTPTAGNCGGGGGGAGGYLYINTASPVTGTGTITANAGAGGGKTGTGVAGTAGDPGVVQQIVW